MLRLLVGVWLPPQVQTSFLFLRLSFFFTLLLKLSSPLNQLSFRLPQLIHHARLLLEEGGGGGALAKPYANTPILRFPHHHLHHLHRPDPIKAFKVGPDPRGQPPPSLPVVSITPKTTGDGQQKSFINLVFIKEVAVRTEMD